MASKSISRWWTVAAGTLGTGLGVGIFIIYVLGALTKPMVADLGFDRSVIAFSLTCFLLTTSIGSISLGVLIHRFGVRRPTFAYLAATAVGIALIPLMPMSPPAFYALFACLGVAGAASTAFPYTVAIAGLFDDRRGLALALAVAGGGLAGAFAPGLTNTLLNAFGWRITLWVVAGIMALPLITLVMCVREPAAVSERHAGDGGGVRAHWSLYLGRRSFWLIAPAMFAIAAGTFILAILVSLLTDRGVSAERAGSILSVAALASLAARIGVGWLLDRFWGPMIASGVCLGGLVGVLLVAYGGDAIPIVGLGAMLLGMALGAEADLLTYLCSRYFSLQAFSRVVGTMWVVWAWGGGIATTAAGVAFRMTGTYDAAMLVLAALLLVGAVAVLFLGPYVYPPLHSAPVKNPPGEPARVA